MFECVLVGIILAAAVGYLAHRARLLWRGGAPGCHCGSAACPLEARDKSGPAI